MYILLVSTSFGHGTEGHVLSRLYCIRKYENTLKLWWEWGSSSSALTPAKALKSKEKHAVVRLSDMCHVCATKNSKKSIKTDRIDAVLKVYHRSSREKCTNGNVLGICSASAPRVESDNDLTKCSISFSKCVFFHQVIES